MTKCNVVSKMESWNRKRVLVKTLGTSKSSLERS